LITEIIDEALLDASGFASWRTSPSAATTGTPTQPRAGVVTTNTPDVLTDTTADLAGAAHGRGRGAWPRVIDTSAKGG
jgi:hypothetical protein